MEWMARSLCARCLLFAELATAAQFVARLNRSGLEVKNLKMIGLSFRSVPGRGSGPGWGEVEDEIPRRPDRPGLDELP